MDERNPGVDAAAMVATGARLGEGVQVAAGAIVGAQVELGARVRIGPGAIVSGHCRIGDDVLVSAGCIVDGGTGEDALVLERGVQLLPGATVTGAVSIAEGARVMEGTVVLKAVPHHAIVSGNPAQIVGYGLSGSTAPEAAIAHAASPPPGVTHSRVRGVTLHRFPRILDLRGNLTVGEFGRTVPFEPKRYFMVFGVPNAEIRGEHAHRTCKQFLVCAQGQCSVVADDGAEREEFLLDDPSIGLYLPPLTWGIQYKYSADAVLLVFASEFYDTHEYIRDYPEFATLARAR